MLAQAMVYAPEVAMRIWILHVRSKKSPASFKYLRRTGDARARQQSRRDAALRRPSRMQKLGLRSIHPAFQQPGCEASRDARRAPQCFGIQAEQFAGQIRRSERSEQSGGMEASAMQLAGRNAAHAARNLIADSDGGDKIAPGNVREF